MNIPLKVKQTLKKVEVSKKAKIVVALSGGKDSAVTAWALHELGYNIRGFHINLGMGDYSERCLEAVKELCDELGIGLVVYDIKNEMGSSMCYLRSKVQATKSLKNCAICGVIKKNILNKEAWKLRADFIATGHNLDDEAQTFLINILKGSPNLSANSGVRTKRKNGKKLVPRIKPLFYIPEDEIRKFSKEKNLPVFYEPCPCALDSYRIQVRSFLEKMPNKDKENIIKNFERLSDKIEKGTDTEINYCGVCGEPSRGKICKMCELVS